MNLLKPNEWRARERPDVAGEVLGDEVEEVLITGVAAGGDVDDRPEKRRTGLETFIRISLAEDRDVGMEVLEIVVEVPVDIRAVDGLAPQRPLACLRSLDRSPCYVFWR